MSSENYPKEIRESLVNFSSKVQNLNSAIVPLVESNRLQLTKDVSYLSLS